jgi:hypothetical protein
MVNDDGPVASLSLTQFCSNQHSLAQYCLSQQSQIQTP